MKTKFFSLLIIFGLFAACSSDEETTIANEKKSIVPKTFSFDTDQNSTLMFQDDEPIEIMTSEARIYSIAKVIRVKPIDEKTIEVSNFAPFDIENATILATIGGTVQVQLFKIKKIRGACYSNYQIPFCRWDYTFS